MPQKEILDISKLHEWKDNPRSITKSGFERLKKQITKLGQYKPLLITPDGEILGGNMRFKAYLELGIKDIWVSVVNPKDENEKLEYALSDNDRAGFYDEDLVANMIPNFDIDWQDYAIDLKEPVNLGDLIDKFTPVEEDEVPEVSDEPAISKLGEVYQLGRHRLMCGDSTKIEDVEKLMDGKKADMVFTDPPYGINVVKNEMVGADFGVAKKGKYSPVVSDETTRTAQDAYNTYIALCVPKIILWGGNYFLDFLPSSDGWLIWDKRGDSGIKNTFADGEMAWCNFHTPVRIYTQLWNGMIREGEHDKRVHPTQKPTKTISQIIKDFSGDGEIILDTFLGSGSTLIACEQTNRICYGMEIDPKYCDVIRKRYSKFIGKEEEWQELTSPVQSLK